ncbi:hypothetical protein [Sphingomonas panni]|uniref:hypothetical protein n=1 Tax=Sphingomonas panni TaxID=237612 RepID=UPI001F5B76C8|nr:hypothetical protein [Sphingomonas panni]
MIDLTPANLMEVRRTSAAFRDVSIWLEEAVFGHRIWYRQTPWLIFLEFLNVAEAFHREGGFLAPTIPGSSYPYSLRFRMGLRHVLFNSGDVARIAARNTDHASAWREWLEGMEDVEGMPPNGFGYLQERFRDFGHFASLVALVRQTSIESGLNKRWSSRFIFPLGTAGLYSDATFERGRVTRDYTVFGRTGELVYLMLSRARRAADLRSRFDGFFDPGDPKHRLVSLLCAPTDERPDRPEGGQMFLPYVSHPAFDRLAEDWLAVLDLSLPERDAFAHLAPLAALHVMIYQLETAAALASAPRPTFVCEMISPRRELVRQRSVASFLGNDALLRRGVGAHLADRLAHWLPGLDEVDPDERLEEMKEMLKEKFAYSPKEANARTIEQLRAGLDAAVDAKLDQNGGLVHLSYGRNVGLVSSRGTNRNRYAPTDALLKTFVLARVPVRLEFGKFLAGLYEFYGLVIGPVEAERALNPEGYDLSSFERNRERLEARLASMGLLNRLSDGCAYVVNPFARRMARP